MKGNKRMTTLTIRGVDNQIITKSMCSNALDRIKKHESNEADDLLFEAVMKKFVAEEY